MGDHNLATTGIPTGFFAYPSNPPLIGETIRAAVEQINLSKLAFLKTWEDCRVGGKVVIHEICKEIDKADLFCADITGLNWNVMFELGYAISRNKRIWLILDTTRTQPHKQFQHLRLLTTTGYVSYCNSVEIQQGFYRDKPYTDLAATLFEQAVKPNLLPQKQEHLLYLKSSHNTNPSIQITKSVDAADVPTIVDDPRESAGQTLTWYGVHVFSASGVVCHFTGTGRDGAEGTNAKYSLVSGLAYGMDKPLIMLSEDSHPAPIDYRDLQRYYQTSTQAAKFLSEWLTPLQNRWSEQRSQAAAYASTVKLATELKGLQLGEYIAENEADKLVEDYFVETSAYLDAREGKHSIFVGRKGVGKTANFLKLASTLSVDRRNLVCVIKPVDYELEGLIDLMEKFKTQRDAKGFAIESLWKFLLYTEIAAKTAATLDDSKRNLTEDEQALLDLVNREQALITGDFSVRLERSVSRLLATTSGSGIAKTRIAVSEALHQTILGELRRLLGKILTGNRRVFLLVDNLDKAWDSRAQVTALSEVLLGLLDAATRLETDFRHQDSKRAAVRVSLVLYMRSDIFFAIRAVAREPDKISFARVQWTDSELLFRVIEERFAASHDKSTNPAEMWSKYFCATVNGIPTKTYLARQILPRPRDLVFFVKAAVATAVNRHHARVEESDLREAAKQYSQHAVETILVEGDSSIGAIENVLYYFSGSPPIIAEETISQTFVGAGLPPGKHAAMLDYLCSVTFLGIETTMDEFRFSEDPIELKRNAILATKFSRDRKSSKRYKVHSAYWPFLDIN